MKISRNGGFSLIELMTTVAIIAVLSLIAVPSYKTFQARARQKEGFALLNGYYSAAIATRTEFGAFPGNFVYTGFAPVGTLNYRLRADDNPNPIPGETAFNSDPGCWNTDLGRCTCSGNCPSFRTWNEMPVAVVGVSLGIASVQAAGVCTIGSFPEPATNNTFLAGIAGLISTTATRVDRYYMDETKTIEMCTDGLK